MSNLNSAAGGRIRLLVKQAWRYMLVALAGLALDFGMLVFLTGVIGVNYLAAAACGFTLGLVLTFLLSEMFVFSGPRVASLLVRFLLFAVVGLIGLGLLTLLMWVQVDLLGWSYITAKVLATGVVYAWNFFARRSLYQAGSPS